MEKEPAWRSLLTDEQDARLQQGAVLLTPNHRLSRACVADYQQRRVAEGRSGWRTPTILAWDHWLNSLYADLFAESLVSQSVLSADESLLLWQKQLNKQEPQLLFGITETAVGAQKAWQLAWDYQYDLDWAESARDLLNTDHQAFVVWARGYREALDAAQQIDAAMLPARLLHLLKAAPERLRGYLPDQLLLVGVHQKTPLRAALFAALAALDVDIVESTDPPSNSHAALYQVVAADIDTETRWAAQWARQCLEVHGVEGRIGVVIPDLHLRRAEVLRTFDQVFFPGATPSEIERCARPFDLSAGQSLAETPPARAALSLFQLLHEPLDQFALSQWLCSPYLANAEKERAQRAQADARLKADGCTALALQVKGAVWARLPEGLREILAAMRTAREQFLITQGASAKGHPGWVDKVSCLPSVWRKLLISTLEAAGWPGPSPGSSEYQAIEAFKVLIDSLGQLDRHQGQVDLRQMLAVLRQVAIRRPFQAEAGDVPIRILGVIESVGLRYDNLWVAAMDNESWPLASPVSPFLPLAWQKAQDIPGAKPDSDLQLGAQRLQHWCAGAEQVVFSHASARDGNPVGVSTQLPKAARVIEFAALVKADTSGIEPGVALEILDDQVGPALAANAQVRGGARLFEDQARCPFRAFVRHRLAVRELEQPVLGLDARLKGNLLHVAMQHFWDAVKTHQNLVSMDDDELAQQIDTAIALSMDEQTEQIAHADIELSRLHRLIDNWLRNYEMPRQPFAIESLEHSREATFCDLVLKLQVDRIDRLENGGRVIIDYKTGKQNSTKSWSETRITSAQLPLYAVLDQPVSGVCFAQTAMNQQRFIGEASEAGLLPGLKLPDYADDWSAAQARWHDNLAMLASEHRTGLAAVTPVKGSCDFCEYRAICRINTLAVETDDAGNDLAMEADA